MSLAGLSILSTWSTLPGYQANLPEPFRASVWDKVLPPVRLLSEVVTQRGLCFPMLMILLLLLVCFHIAGTLKGFSITTPHSEEGPTRWGSPSPSSRLSFATDERLGTGLLSHQL